MDWHIDFHDVFLVPDAADEAGLVSEDPGQIVVVLVIVVYLGLDPFVVKANRIFHPRDFLFQLLYDQGLAVARVEFVEGVLSSEFAGFCCCLAVDQGSCTPGRFEVLLYVFVEHLVLLRLENSPSVSCEVEKGRLFVLLLLDPLSQLAQLG